ncbi:hypothetical protein LV75_001409 [Actinokineospora diospyrosa]|uniref:Uncharacterized protein n=1 Tax=Actinokineospora diospyrosa TaxID=103728 RepID=A0ABT1I8G9_9PSEU|nr:hypothetical protein [Actinokineospora diospyrosa]
MVLRGHVPGTTALARTLFRTTSSHGDTRQCHPGSDALSTTEDNRVRPGQRLLPLECPPAHHPRAPIQNFSRAALLHAPSRRSRPPGPRLPAPTRHAFDPAAPPRARPRPSGARPPPSPGGDPGASLPGPTDKGSWKRVAEIHMWITSVPGTGESRSPSRHGAPGRSASRAGPGGWWSEAESQVRRLGDQCESRSARNRAGPVRPHNAPRTRGSGAQPPPSPGGGPRASLLGPTHSGSWETQAEDPHVDNFCRWNG